MSINWADLDRNHLAEKLEEVRDTILAGLNAGNGDGEWEALVDAAEILGIEYDDEEARYE